MRYWISSVLLSSVLVTMGAIAPGLAAETLNLVFGAQSQQGIQIPVADLRAYAETGTASGNLKLMLSMATPEQQAEFRQLLSLPFPVTAEQLQTLASNNKGEDLLKAVAAATLRPDSEGIAALKTAMMKGLEAEGGLTLLAFLDAYPESTMTIDIMQMQAILEANKPLMEQYLSRQQQPAN